MNVARLTPTKFALAAATITDAFCTLTRRDICIHTCGIREGITAIETVDQFDLYPNVAHYHLKKLRDRFCVIDIFS